MWHLETPLTYHNRSHASATIQDTLSLDDAWAPACLLALCGWRSRSFLLRQLLFMPVILLCLYNNALVATVCLWAVSIQPPERHHYESLDDFATSSSDDNDDDDDDDDDDEDLHDSIAARVKARHARKRMACLQVQVQLSLPEDHIANFTSSPPRRTERIGRSLTRRSMRIARKRAPSRRAKQL